jgi:uncharacterized SAM-binding protein YcdF (DUF218 family)
MSEAMLYAHKILPALVMPLALAGLCIAYGAWRKRMRWVWVALALLYAASTPFVAGTLFAQVERGMRRLGPGEAPAAQAIVVLSGMLHGVPGLKGVAVEWGDPDRFFGGVELYKAGRAPLLVFTGGQVPWQRNPPEGITLKAYAEAMGVPGAAIRVTRGAGNTAEEALAVRALLGEGVRDLLLVTSAFHMPRSATLFRRAGFQVREYPVDFKVGVADTTPMDFLPAAHALVLTEMGLRELLGRAYYWWRG